MSQLCHNAAEHTFALMKLFLPFSFFFVFDSCLVYHFRCLCTVVRKEQSNCGNRRPLSLRSLKVQQFMLKYKYCRHSTTPEPSPRSLSNNNSPGHSFKGSTSSLASSSDGMSLRRKKKAPAPPPPKVATEMKVNDYSSCGLSSLN
jgi:hypothetical protein